MKCFTGLCVVWAIAFSFAASPCFGEIVANFTDGNDDTSGGANPPSVDSFRGTPGLGWVSSWGQYTNLGPPVMMSGVEDTLPVNGGDNYLNVTLDYETGGNFFGQGAVTRQYADTTDQDQLSQQHTISFDFRADTGIELGSIEDRFQIWDNSTGFQSSTQPTSTWIIAAYGNGSGTGPAGIVGGNWGFISGHPTETGFGLQTFVDTGFTVTAGTTYHFEVTTDPTTKTWVAKISDGVTEFASGSLNWRNRTAISAGGHVYWGMQKRRDLGVDPYGFSLDNISISIELPPIVLFGDYNGDAVVNAADYTIWRDKLGTEFELPNRGAGITGNVSQQDYDIWKLHFGETQMVGAGGATVSVPELSTAVLMTVAGLLVACIRRRHLATLH
jgi:hypothetical protein